MGKLHSIHSCRIWRDFFCQRVLPDVRRPLSDAIGLYYVTDISFSVEAVRFGENTISAQCCPMPISAFSELSTCVHTLYSCYNAPVCRPDIPTTWHLNCSTQSDRHRQSIIYTPFASLSPQESMTDDERF